MARRQDVTIDRQAVRKYQRLLDRQAEKAGSYIDRAVAAYMRQHPGAGTAQVRKFTFELMQDALPNFTDLAETLSCEFMEEVAARHGWEDVHPEIVGTTDYGLVEKRLRYLAGHLAGGDAEKYREGVLDATRFYVKRAAQDAMVENCGKAKLRFARVPSGFETCAFCFMLASRGFVYRSELSAGLGHAYHPHCSCTIVPGAKGTTRIDGYDPKGMADRWEQCARTCGSRKDEDVMKEVETRDWHWLYTGEVPQYLQEDGADPDEFEKEAGRLLREANGYRVEFKKRSLLIHDRRADSLIGGERYEIKNPTGSGGLTVHNQIKKNLYGSGREKMLNPQGDRMVITNVRSRHSFEELIRQAKEALSGDTGFTDEELDCMKEIIVLDRDGRALKLG